MQRVNPQAHITAINLLSHFLRAMALGVACAGLLLFDPKIDLTSVLSVHQEWLARLIFLLWIGISFGLGSMLAKIL